jgi:hypothetical protein
MSLVHDICIFLSLYHAASLFLSKNVSIHFFVDNV